MNDSQEMEYFIRELKSAVKKQIQPSFYEKAENLFSENLKDFNKLASYAACFSEYKDDAAQWSRYAKNGTGVYIAFDKDLLFKIGNAGHAPLYKVNYSANCDDLENVDDIVDSVLHPEKYSTEKIHEIFNRLITNSPFFKHLSFSSEKEYRLVSLPYNQTEFLGKPQFYVEENNIKKILHLKSKIHLSKTWNKLHRIIYRNLHWTTSSRSKKRARRLFLLLRISRTLRKNKSF